MPSPVRNVLEPLPLGRSATWPPTSTVRAATAMRHGERIHMSQVPPLDMPAPRQPKAIDLFEYELDRHPEDHFLSPIQMYEYEDWADDSDGEEVAWDAGITDFALFDNDRRQAQEGRPLPDRWNHLLESQASALQRAVERNRASSDPSRQTWTPLIDDLPQLTPDNSPTLRDHFDIRSHYSQNRSRNINTLRRTVPAYLQQSPPSDEETSESDLENDSEDEDDLDLPVAYLVERARERRRQARKLERPGMRFNRTMSGKVHVWRRPSSQMYTLRESPEAERTAEVTGYQYQKTGLGVNERGRRR